MRNNPMLEFDDVRYSVPFMFWGVYPDYEDEDLEDAED